MLPILIPIIGNGFVSSVLPNNLMYVEDERTRTGSLQLLKVAYSRTCGRTYLQYKNRDVEGAKNVTSLQNASRGTKRVLCSPKNADINKGIQNLNPKS
jgi:hypothetical protein